MKAIIPRNVSSLRKDLTVIFFIAIFIILTIDFWLIDAQEIIPLGSKFGKIIYNLSFTYVSAFFFYFLVVHLKYQKDQQNVQKYIAKKTESIIIEAHDLISQLKMIFNIQLQNTFPCDSELEEVCNKVKINSETPLQNISNGTNANILQYFYYCKSNTDIALTKILSKLQYLDSEFVNILLQIEDCRHFRIVTLLVNSDIPYDKTSNLNAFKNDIYKYLELIKELEKYYKLKILS